MSTKLFNKTTSGSLFESIYNYVPFSIFITEPDGIIIHANIAAVKEFGYSRKEILGEKILLLMPAIALHSRNFYESKKIDATGIRNDKSTFPLEATIKINEENDSLIWFINDLTGIKNAEIHIKELKNELEEHVANRTKTLTEAMQQLEDSKERLSHLLDQEKEHNELKSRFVSMASHEFRTPLSTILSSAYLIEKYSNTEDQPKREKHLKRIVSSVNNLTDILNDFLSVGKMEEGRIQVRPVSVNIKELIIEIAGELKNILKKQQRIHYRHEGNLEVLTDASLMRHIVQNLVSNASKFSPEGSGIDLKTICNNDQLILTVKDYGIGISKTDQKHLMERFFRGANAGNIQGTGLGLHIVSKYAEMLNGQVTWTSELEKGSEFIITFNQTEELHENHTPY